MTEPLQTTGAASIPGDLGRLASEQGYREALASRQDSADGLVRLERRVRDDLALLNLPPPSWVPKQAAPDGGTMLDVLVVGAGMSGQSVGIGLLREGVDRIRVIDRSPPGEEGPWGTYARMEMLRSPKQLTGPDFGQPSLTFRAWYEARFGRDGWERLYKVWRTDWRDYLLWVRRRSGLQVENRTSMRSVRPYRGALQVVLDRLPDREPGPMISARAESTGEAIAKSHPDDCETIYVRKLVLALGRDGSGAARWPMFASLDPSAPRVRSRVFHSSDSIPFERFAGRRIGVLGVGASAFDNAARALEARASAVTMFARRDRLAQVNKSKSASFPGFFSGFHRLDDASRLRVYRHVFDEQTPPPFESVLRCDRHPAFSLRFGEPWLDLSVDPKIDSKDLKGDVPSVRVTTAHGRYAFDAVILATGFDVALIDRPELAEFVDDIAMWGDRDVMRPDTACGRAVGGSASDGQLARFPHLGPGFELQSRSPGLQPLLQDIHLFNWGATLSHGAVSGDIPGIGTGVRRLVEALVRDLYLADADLHYQALLAFQERELAPTRYGG